MRKNKPNVNSILPWASIIIASICLIYTKCQTDVVSRELEIIEQKYNVELTASWESIRYTMQEVLMSGPQEGYIGFAQFSAENKIEWLHSTEVLLRSQTSNPVLIGDTLSLGYWRNALSCSYTARMILQANSFLEEEADSFFVRSSSSILRDVSFVWERLVLDSNQISPTGGRPNE